MSAVRRWSTVDGLTRIFDVSKPWLNRVIEREPRLLLQGGGRRRASQIARRRDLRAGRRIRLAASRPSRKMVVGLLPPTAGEVTIDGVDMCERDSASRDDGAAPPHPDDLPGPLREPQSALAGRRASSPSRSAPSASPRTPPRPRRSVGELLRLVGLDPADGSKYPHEFSGGQRQRIASRARLSSEPEFIVCDEPTSALDVSVQAQILNLMRDLQDRLGLTYLFISHNLAVVRHMATRDRRHVSRPPGRDGADGASCSRAPRHPYTRMLLDAVPDLDMSGRPRKPVEGEIPNPINPPPGCTFHPRCPLAFDRCRSEVPQPIADGARTVACHAVAAGRT